MNEHVSMFWLALTLILSSGGCGKSFPGEQYFAIKVVDHSTQRAIPLVQLKTLNSLVFHTDNAGFIAFSEEDLLHQNLYFEIKSAGYRYPMDKSGRQGVSLQIIPGKDTTLYLRRINTAERLYRITGPGQYVHSNKLLPEGERISTLRGGVLGQDSNLGVLYNGKIFWAWGDSFLPPEYHGNFSVASAWSKMPEQGNWTPEEGIEFDYVVDKEGWSKPMIMLDGPGYVWFDWLMNIPGVESGEKLVAKYSRVNAYFGNYERGIAVFNDQKEIFEKYADEPAWLADIATMDHPFKGSSKGDEYYYTTSEFLFTRIKPVLTEMAEAANYEVFTPLLSNSDSGTDAIKIDRDAAGAIRYGWKKNVPRLNYGKQKEMITQGLISPEESHIHTIDMKTGDEVDVSRGSISWNAFRQRWILIAGKQDVWYGEADTPVGPWAYVSKVAAHDQFYYNPVHHSFLDQDDGSRIFFEGTFTKFFSKEPPIPRYDYNQLMYGLSLDHPDLKIPVPVYEIVKDEKWRLGLKLDAMDDPTSVKAVSFFALEQKPDHPAVIPIYPLDGPGKLSLSAVEGESLVFYAVNSSFDRSKFFEGHWELKIAFKSFDNSVGIELKEGTDNWKIMPTKYSFEFSELKIDATAMQVILRHDGARYELKGQIDAGQLTGEFTSGDGSNGSWTAEKVEKEWWPLLSDRIVPLYEHEDKNGQFRYSTKKASGQKESILCHVWENPSSVLAVDFDIRPVGR